MHSPARSVRPPRLVGTAIVPRLLGVLVLMVALPAQARVSAPARQGAIDSPDFDREVRPILAEHCFACHGPDASKRRAGLRLDVQAAALAPLDSGHVAIEPGNPAGSALVARIRSHDPDFRMPPPAGRVGEGLTERQKDTLEAWIAAGAAWSPHYAFRPLTKPGVPAVRDADCAIDAFVRARLPDGLAPSREADRYTLIRRATLDLTGLPPTLAEVREFVEDPAPDAYARVVERLLGSSQHAEHMARFWLDAARYADTHGLHLDNYREMWPYRDWVIQAFRDNLGYDEFLRKQLAGDLLPNANLADQIASGFNRCHVTTNEGGSITEEVRVRNVVERVSAFGTVFMGMTVGCAVCHDHKFDPISQREFYGLSAFFNSIDGSPLDGNRKDHEPVVRVPSADQRVEQARLQHRIRKLEREIDAAVAATDYDPDLAPPADDSVALTSGPLRQVRWFEDELPPGAEVVGREFAFVGRGADRGFEVQAGEQFAFVRSARPLTVTEDTELVAWFRIDPERIPQAVMVQWNSTGTGNGWNHGVYLGSEAIPFGAAGTPARVRIGDLTVDEGRWQQVAVPAARVGLAAGDTIHGLAITVNGGTARWNRIGIVTGSRGIGPSDYYWVDDSLPAGAQPRGNGEIWQWQAGGTPEPVAGAKVWRRRGRGLNQDFFEGADPLIVQPGDRLIAHVWIDPADPPRSIQLQYHSGNWEHRARWGAPAFGGGGRGGSDFVASTGLPPTGRWVRLEVRPADVGLKPGAAIDGFAFTQVDGTLYWDAAGVHTWSPPDGRHLWSLELWSERAVNDARLPEPVRAAAQIDRAERTPAQQRVLRDHFVRHVWAHNRASMQPRLSALESARNAQRELAAAVPTTLVMREQTRARPTYVLRRGQYDARGEAVRRITPGFLPPFRARWPRNRVGLAEWLLDRDHPLTARVAVNRLWQQVFSRGLVETSEDFGNQGARPTHPELLDWLAATFVEDGWDVRRLLQRIVMSATYRQASTVTEAHLRIDPENRYLARASRVRLDAEVLRDSALAFGGLLVDRVGGPSVKPPQPDGLWKAVGYSSSNTARFVADQEPEHIWRRSLYTFWKRTAPAPQMSTFDAPSRESCSVRRERTNTPLQALLLMNDPQYVEAARGLALRILRAGLDPESVPAGPAAGDSSRLDRPRAARALFLVTGRPPSTAEIDRVVRFLRRQRARFTADPDAARALIQVGKLPNDARFEAAEIAAWTFVANLLLNLDAVVSKP